MHQPPLTGNISIHNSYTTSNGFSDFYSVQFEKKIWFSLLGDFSFLKIFYFIVAMYSIDENIPVSTQNHSGQEYSNANAYLFY